ncbi:MAG TPA: hypothetical protein DCW44_02835 [Eubacterium sp.]|nr:hypothetical protein [Eubacterium sp.]
MNDYKIKELYEKMEMDLIDSMKRNLSRHLAEEEEVGFKYTQWQAEKLKELKRFQRENKKIIGGYVKGLNKEVSKHLQEELKQGSISAIKHYNKVLGDNKNPSKLMNRSFFRTNDRKVKALIKAVNNDLNKANIGALRMINDEYRQIIHKSAFFVANGVKTEKQATSMAIKEISEKKATMQACDEVSKSFLAGGLNCIEYSNGRKVNIASYAAMAVRTASIRAHLMGEGDFRKSIGRTLIKVSTHGGTCKLCARWQGRVLIDDVYSGGEPDGKHTLLSEAMEQGLFHPNCRHGIFTYYPELEGISYDEDEGDEYLPDFLKEKYNYYDRLGKSWNRRSRGFIDPDNKKDARKNYLACEKKKENIIQIVNNKYKNLTNVTKNNRIKGRIPNRRLNYSVDSEGNKYKNFFFEENKKITNEIKYQKILERYLNEEVSLNPKARGIDGKRFSDYWIKKKSKAWDLKTLDGESTEIIDNVLGKACKKKQAPNIVMHVGECPHSNNYLKEKLIETFEKGKRPYVKEVMLFSKKDNLLLHLKRK